MSHKSQDLGAKRARHPEGFVLADDVSTWLVTGDDGLERRAWLFIPSGPDGDRPVLLCPHPFGLTAIGNLFGEHAGHRTLVDIPGVAASARRHGVAVLSLAAEGARVTGASLGWPAHLDAYPTALHQAAAAGKPVDTEAVVAAGLSMGGQEAILLGCRHPGLIKAAAAQSPVTDVEAWHRHLSGIEGGAAHAAVIRAEVGSAPEGWAERSPMSQVSAARGLRLQIRLNTWDSLVPAREHGLAYAAALGAAGHPPQVVNDLPAQLDSRDPGRAAHEHVSWDAMLTWLATALPGDGIRSGIGLTP